jgi:choice-of-anchor A domain-containing protein
MMTTMWKSQWRAALAAAALLWPVLAPAQEIDLGAARRYAAFILGDVSGLEQVEGRLAVGRNLNAAKLDVGKTVPGGDPASPSLVVGRNIAAYTTGGIWSAGGLKGYGVYAAGLADASAELDLRQDDTVIDFPAETAWLMMLSSSLGSRSATGKVTELLGTVTLTGTNAQLEVFKLTAAQVLAGKTLALANIKSGAWIVLIVAADAQLQVALGWDSTALQAIKNRVLYTLNDTDVLTLSGATVWGSVLAPYAWVKGLSGRVEGTVVASTWVGPAVIGNALLQSGP